jgi:hypothetical protein
MDPVVSWVIFIFVIVAVWYLNKRQNAPVPKKVESPPEKAKAAFVSTAGSGNDASDAKKKTKKKTKKSPAPAVAPKEVVSSANQSDDDVAEEVSLREVARRVKNQGASLKPSATRNYAASQTSADGDIDDEEFVKGSSTDPSDMLETSTTGPGVLRIGAPTQPPRGQKQKKSSTTPEPGLHAAKNTKKKEKKKAERAEERALQQTRLEAHRKAQRAEEAKQPDVTAPSDSAWTPVTTGKKSPAPKAATPPPALLDTFTPADSADETIAASTTLGDSWESIPRGLQVPEPEWNEVKSKKGRKDRKADDSDVPRSSDEREPSAPKAKAVTPAPEFSKPTPPPPAPKLAVQKKNTSSTNNFAALDNRTASGSDWTSVEDNIENWVAHPESSDY